MLSSSFFPAAVHDPVITIDAVALQMVYAAQICVNYKTAAIKKRKKKF